jgi:hypothetical protein
MSSKRTLRSFVFMGRAKRLPGTPVSPFDPAAGGKADRPSRGVARPARSERRSRDSARAQ